ncbi:MAG: DNA topoisomerase IB [Chloroflexi bacterium]|nr:MAG: DNA topoisomerase IB [Chloroflexota bacterium]TME56897.1 MAG: DNA topoisomerase IB [Chloroflexota bacterium]
MPRAQGLIYSIDAEPGIKRVRRGRGFQYRRPSGSSVRDAATLRRIAGVAVPPAWTDVWINPNPRGHIQATGRDARGRKQFRYHTLWTAHRDADKFSQVVGFCRVLPRIRRRVSRDLRAPGLSQEKVIAAIVRLLERTFIRVGNEEYASQNGSFGLTTLRDRHAKVRGATIRLSFPGKSGKDVEAEVTDPRVARVVRRCQELPGQVLFGYVDESGERRTVSSEDVNDYLRETTGADYTAKDFRTWGGTVLAAVALRGVEGFESEVAAKRNVVAAIDKVARRLGNTRAVARRSYVHPAVIDAYMEHDLDAALSGESAVLEVLRRRHS